MTQIKKKEDVMIIKDKGDLVDRFNQSVNDIGDKAEKLIDGFRALF